MAKLTQQKHAMVHGRHALRRFMHVPRVSACATSPSLYCRVYKFMIEAGMNTVFHAYAESLDVSIEHAWESLDTLKTGEGRGLVLQVTNMKSCSRHVNMRQNCKKWTVSMLSITCAAGSVPCKTVYSKYRLLSVA